MSRWFALAAVVVLIVAFGAGLILQFGSKLSDQIAYLVQNTPQALRRLSESFDLAAVSDQVGGSAIGALAAVGAILIVGVNGRDRVAAAPEGCILEGAEDVGGPIDLVDENGARVTQADFEGEPKPWAAIARDFALP